MHRLLPTPSGDWCLFTLWPSCNKACCFHLLVQTTVADGRQFVKMVIVTCGQQQCTALFKQSPGNASSTDCSAFARSAASTSLVRSCQGSHSVQCQQETLTGQPGRPNCLAVQPLNYVSALNTGKRINGILQEQYGGWKRALSPSAVNHRRSLFPVPEALRAWPIIFQIGSGVRLLHYAQLPGGTSLTRQKRHP
jgi:hypothetical protein